MGGKHPCEDYSLYDSSLVLMSKQEPEQYYPDGIWPN